MDYLAKNWKSLLVIAFTIVGFILLTTSCLAPIITWAKIGDKSLIITFIGVLATFVVVGNFAQTSYILSETKEKLQGYEERIKKGEDASKKVETIETKVETAENILNSLSNQKPLIEEKDLAKLLIIFKYYYSARFFEQLYLYNMLQRADSVYPLKMKDNSDLEAKIYLNADNNIEFKTTDDKPINMDDIITVKGVKFNYDNLNYVYQLLQQVETTDTSDVNNDTMGTNAPINDEITK